MLHIARKRAGKADLPKMENKIQNNSGPIVDGTFFDQCSRLGCFPAAQGLVWWWGMSTKSIKPGSTWYFTETKLGVPNGFPWCSHGFSIIFRYESSITSTAPRVTAPQRVPGTRLMQPWNSPKNSCCGRCHFVTRRIRDITAWFHGLPGLRNIQKAIEHGHRNSGFTHWKWWFSIVMLVYQRVNPFLSWLKRVVPSHYSPV